MWTNDKERRLEMLTDRFNSFTSHYIRERVHERTKYLEDQIDQHKWFHKELMEAAFEKHQHEYACLSKVRELLWRGPKREE